MTAGKRVHGTGSVPGGVNKSLSRDERDLLLKDVVSDGGLEPRCGASGQAS